MEEHIAKLYGEATRFDEGDLIQGADYRAALAEQFKYYDRMVEAFGQEIVPLLEEYTCALYGEMECEAQHYFQEGYRAAKKET